MIVKYFDLNKINFNKDHYILLHGANEGAKSDEIVNILSQNIDREIVKYDENEILNNIDEIYNRLLSKSLFENKKIIIINRSSDKILKFISELLERKIQDVSIILKASVLEKKSKLRSLFEKSKTLVTVPFYEDTHSILSSIAQKFFREKKINISPSNINLLIQKCNGDRANLRNELKKIEHFCKNRKTITSEELNKLTNLIENFSISELVDNCLAKNLKKTINILNENVFNSEDSIIILRTFHYKLKRMQRIMEDFIENGNLEKSISNAKPPIFWKDKDIVKQQLKSWKIDEIKQLIFDINDIEYKAKKNLNNSIYLATDLILDKAS